MRCSDKMIITEVLRLHEQFNYSLRKIEDSSMCSKTTAAKIIKCCIELGLDYETAKTFSNEELKKLVFNEPVGRPSKLLPDFEKIHQKITKVTIPLQSR
ncbi:MAG: hypothetical protein EOM67_07420 [Spirochaetia bacterium]|nr:hypothetical protein [Spirochaetia bacterium]